MWSYNYSDELYHHGIKGQRWGIRRYQNKDGTLTPAGKKRAAKLESEYEKVTGKKMGSSSSSNSKKSMKEMTDAELKSRTDRMIAEKNYLEAKKNLDSLNPKQVSLGKKFVKEYGPIVAKTLWNDVGKKYIEKQLGLSDSKVSESAKLKQKAEDLENKKKIANAEDFFKKREEKQAEARKAEDSKTKQKTETYEGTVEGSGTSSKKQSETRSQRRDTGPIDVDWKDVTDDSYNYGKSYVNRFLLEDKRSK